MESEIDGVLMTRARIYESPRNLDLFAETHPCTQAWTHAHPPTHRHAGMHQHTPKCVHMHTHIHSHTKHVFWSLKKVELFHYPTDWLDLAGSAQHSQPD